MKTRPLPPTPWRGPYFGGGPPRAVSHEGRSFSGIRCENPDIVLTVETETLDMVLEKRKATKTKTVKTVKTAAKPKTAAAKAVDADPVEVEAPKKMGRPKLSNRIELEEEALKLKNEKYKLLLRDWRKERDRMIAMAIVEALKTALLDLADCVKKGMGINRAIDRVVKSIDTLDLDIVLSAVEVDDDDEGDEP